MIIKGQSVSTDMTIKGQSVSTDMTIKGQPVSTNITISYIKISKININIVIKKNHHKFFSEIYEKKFVGKYPIC